MAFPVKNITGTTYIPKGSVEHIVSPGAGKTRRKPSPVQLMGVSSLLPGYLVVRTPAYPFHVLLMIRAGTLRFRDAPDSGHDQEFSAGDMLFLPAGSWYMYGTDAPLELVWFHLHPEAAEWLPLKGAKRFHGTAADPECLCTLISVIYREQAMRGTGESAIANCGIRMTEALLDRILNRSAPESESAARVRTLFETLEASLEKKWTVAAMARQAGISTSTLFAVSRNCFGVSPMARLHELRMNAAANLLRLTPYKLEAVASMVGLGCAFSLSRAFRKFHGIAPRDYRNRFRANAASLRK